MGLTCLCVCVCVFGKKGVGAQRRSFGGERGGGGDKLGRA